MNKKNSRILSASLAAAMTAALVIPAAADLARRAAELGADAVLVQDLGVLRAARQAAPDLTFHASTQMTVHNLDGVKACADLGLKRAVLSRELPA